MKVNYDVTHPQKGDFLIDGKYLFEVGGKGKTFDQIADIPDSYLAPLGLAGLVLPAPWDAHSWGFSVSPTGLE